MRKTVAIISLIIIVGILLYPGFVASYNFGYKLDKTNNEVIITGIKTLKQREKYELTIPKKIYLRRVTAIDFRAGFKQWGNAPRRFTRLEMPDSVTRIGQRSFWLKPNLEEI